MNKFNYKFLIININIIEIIVIQYLNFPVF
jgi:hypothetical protein